MPTVHHIINEIGQRDGGAEKIARMLHHGLLERGIDSRLISLKEGQLDDVENSHSLGVERVYQLRSILRIRNYIKQHCADSDLIHAHLFPTNLFVSLAVQSLGWKGTLVTTEHSTSNRRRKMFGGKLLDRLIYRAYKRIFCISNGTRNSLASWLPKLSDRLVVIENGVLLHNETFVERPDRIPPRIVSVGRVNEIKNYAAALDAMELLDDLDFQYEIAGEGDQKQTLIERVEQSELKGKVEFLGYVEDTKELLESADIFLNTSKWEGFGMAVVEAMNFGLPVVVSDVEGLRDVVRGKEDGGQLVDVTNQQVLANSLRALVINRDDRIELGRNAFRRSGSFSSLQMVESYVRSYADFSDLASKAN